MRPAAPRTSRRVVFICYRKMGNSPESGAGTGRATQVVLIARPDRNALNRGFREDVSDVTIPNGTISLQPVFRRHRPAGGDFK